MRILSAISLLLLGPPALAMQRAVAPAVLCDQTPLVVEAEVTGTEGVWNGSVIETHLDLHVHRTFKGDLTGDSLQIVIPGGTASGVTLTISESPTLLTDHRYLLLLTPRPDGAWTVSGGPQGAFALTGAQAVPLPQLTERLEGCHVR